MRPISLKIALNVVRHGTQSFDIEKSKNFQIFLEKKPNFTLLKKRKSIFDVNFRYKSDKNHTCKSLRFFLRPSSPLETFHYIYSYHRLLAKNSRTCRIRCHQYRHFRFTWEYKNLSKGTSPGPQLDGMSNYYKVLAYIVENQFSVFKKKVRNFNEMGNSRF